jgi:hypothetical protein
LAPLSGSNDEEADQPEAPQPAVSHVWRRRWLVVAAAVVAFLTALGFGRLTAPRRAEAPLPTLSGASEPSKLDAPAIGADLEQGSPTAQATEVPVPAANELAAREKPRATPTAAATSDTLEMPAMEVPPSKGTASSGKIRVRRSAASSTDPPPHKRFMPGSI